MNENRTDNLSRIGTKDVVKRKVGVMSIVGMFYAIVCAGAYGIEEMLPACGPGLTILLLAVLPLIWAYPYGMICAEMGAIRPCEGGTLIWIKEAFGEFWFSIVAIINVIWGLVCNTVYVVLAVSYLGSIIPMTETEAYFLKLFMIVVFFVINVAGLKEVSFVSTVLSILIIATFALCAFVGFTNWNTNPVEPFIPPDVSITEGLGTGLSIGIWMYAGFDAMSLFGGEIENSEKVIPRGIMLVIPLIAMTYILPTLGGLASIGNWESWTTEPGGIGYATVLTDNLGNVFGAVFIVVAIIGQCSIYNATMATGSRGILIAADENLGPKFFARLTKKKGSPYVAIFMVAFISALLIPFSFDFLVVVEVFFMVFVTAMTVLACYKIRSKTPKDQIPFRIPGGTPVHTLMCISVFVICVLTTLLNGTDWYLGGLLWILIIPVLYVLNKLIFKGCTVKEPELYPINPRTKLGYNDTFKIGGFYMGIGIYAILGQFFLRWYEGEWAHEYYLETWGSGLFSDFDLMLNVINITGVTVIILGLIIYLIGKKVEPKNNSK